MESYRKSTTLSLKFSQKRIEKGARAAYIWFRKEFLVPEMVKLTQNEETAISSDPCLSSLMHSNDAHMLRKIDAKLKAVMDLLLQ